VLDRMLGSSGVIAGGKINAVVDRMVEDPAVQCVAIDAALSMEGKRNS
jgi:hypothetical protein